MLLRAPNVKKKNIVSMSAELIALIRETLTEKQMRCKEEKG